ncbi:MAG: 6-carboxytetrahydropterin synthase QueD [Planctomycetota bacterium]
MEIFREFSFDSAHRLEGLPEGHKCARTHGHTYRLVVHVEGPLDPKLRWVFDFAELKRVVHRVIDPLDHQMLNEIEGLEQPSAEVIVAWIWARLKPSLPGLTKLVLFENRTSGVVYRGEPLD